VAYIRKTNTGKYRAEVVKSENGVITNRVSKTFTLRKDAIAWGVNTENEHIAPIGDILTVKNVCKSYLDLFPQGHSKTASIGILARSSFCDVQVSKLKQHHLIKHGSERLRLVKPQTLKNDFIYLKIVLQTMAGIMGFKFDRDLFESVQITLKRERMIKRSDKRDRLPTYPEIMQLSRYFKRVYPPMVQVMLFAMSSCRRLGEITALRVDDINDGTILVRDIKHPTSKIGNNRRARLTRFSERLINKQPSQNALIFPYNHKNLSRHFTRACQMLGIENLHFHDLRHYAVSKLFREGYAVHEVIHFSLHMTYDDLKTYNNQKASDIKLR
jgi:integrase